MNNNELENRDSDNVLTDIETKMLKRFNWGAFLISPIWSLMYGQWVWVLILSITLYFTWFTGLSLIFLVIFYVLSIILGKKAFRIAWKKYRKENCSVQDLVKIESRWIIRGLILHLLVVLSRLGAILGEYQRYLYTMK